MKKITILTVFLFSFVLGVQAVDAHNLQRGDKIQAKVVSVHDGDTLTIFYKGEKIKIRLYAIDAPELKQAYGKYAKETLELWTEDKIVWILVRDFDRYGRVVATVIGEGMMSGAVDVAYRLLEKGEAWYEAKYCDESRYSSLCADYSHAFEVAKANKEGLFSRKNPVHPAVFRKNKQK